MMGPCAVCPAAVLPQLHAGPTLEASLVTSRQLTGWKQQKAAVVYFGPVTLSVTTEQRYDIKRTACLQEPAVGVM